MVFCVAFGFGCPAFAAVSFATFLVRVRCWLSSSRVAAVSFVLNVGSLSGVGFYPSRLALVLVVRGGFVSFGGKSIKCSEISPA